MSREKDLQLLFPLGCLTDRHKLRDDTLIFTENELSFTTNIFFHHKPLSRMLNRRTSFGSLVPIR